MNNYVLEINIKKKDNFLVNSQNIQLLYSDSYMNLYCDSASGFINDNEYWFFVYGHVFINNKRIRGSDLKLLRKLISEEESMISNISGDFHIYIYDKYSKNLHLYNSHLGMLPLYKAFIKGETVFTNRLDNIRLSNNFNKATLIEYLLFNYPISDNTFFESITTVPPASHLNIEENKVYENKYWKVEDILFQKYEKNTKKSRDILDQALENVIEKYTQNFSNIGVSLTGGWDGRLLLSYLLKNGQTDFFLYSFGTPDAPDIQIPDEISEKLSLTYFPYLLDDEYYKNYFLSSAIENIIYTDGIRPFTRAHYYYALKEVGRKTDLILSGNCASNLVKFANRKPSDVYNHNVVELLFADQKEDFIYRKIKELENKLKVSIDNKVKERTIEQITQSDIYLKGASKSQLFYKVLLQNIERKYYGFEMLGYSNYVSNLSPFIDIEFLSDLARTNYFGAHHDYDVKSLKSRWMSSYLYAKLIKKNFPKLGAFITDRGFSTNDILTFPGMIKVYKKKFTKPRKSQKKDYYGMPYAFSSVLDYVKAMDNIEFPFNVNLKKLENLSISDNRNKNIVGNYLSFLIWKSHVEQKK